MAVDGDDVEAEGGELLVQGLQRHDVLGGAVDLEAVHVHDDAQVIQLVLGGGHKGLPALALVQLAVAHDGVDAVVLVVELAAQGHANGGGDALAQGAGGHVHAPDVVHLYVAGHVAVDAAEHVQVVHGEEAPQRQNGIEGGAAVALGHDEAVTVRVLGVLGVHVHDVEVQGSDQVQAGHGAAGVAGGGVVDHGQAQNAGLVGLDRQLLIRKWLHIGSTFLLFFPTGGK